jgi:hypothetical protein
MSLDFIMNPSTTPNHTTMDFDTVLANASGANYFELYLLAKKGNRAHESLSFQMYDVNHDENSFFNILAKLKKAEYKYFQKEYKEYHQKNVCRQSYTNDEVRVFKTNTVQSQSVYDEAFLAVTQYRTKLTLLNFPSSLSIDAVSYVKQLIFRVSNRVYINFKISLDQFTKEKAYTIFINYNHEDNVDLVSVKKQIERVVQWLASTC